MRPLRWRTALEINIRSNGALIETCARAAVMQRDGTVLVLLVFLFHLVPPVVRDTNQTENRQRHNTSDGAHNDGT